MLCLRKCTALNMSKQEQDSGNRNDISWAPRRKKNHGHTVRIFPYKAFGASVPSGLTAFQVNDELYISINQAQTFQYIM